MSTTVEVVQLARPDPGRRFAPAERDAAFLVFMGEGRQNYTTTANLTGIHRHTLMKWADQDDWDGRISGAGNAAASAVEVARSMFPFIITAAAGEWLRLLRDPKANANAKAKLIEMAYGMHGMVVPKQSMNVVQHMSSDERTVISLKDLAELDPDTLAAWSEGSTDDDTEGGEG